MNAAQTPTEILLATGNPNKVREVREVLEPLGVRVLSLTDLYPADALPPEPEEDGLTFEDNARKKAVGYAQLTGRACVAEDSGLEVDALEGAPGVHSARYAGVDGSREVRDAANNAKLLAALEGVPTHERTAHALPSAPAHKAHTEDTEQHGTQREACCSS